MNDLGRLKEMAGIREDKNDLYRKQRIEDLVTVSRKYQFYVDGNGKISVYNDDASQRWFFDNFDDMIEKGLGR